MMIRKCPKCGKYTLQDDCCTKTKDAHPPSPALTEKYAKYRK